MITADSITRTADEICWTADGYDGCFLEYFGAFDDELEIAETKKKDLEKKLDNNLLKQSKEFKKIEAKNKIKALRKNSELLIRLIEESDSLTDQLKSLKIDSINREKSLKDEEIAYISMFLLM